MDGRDPGAVAAAPVTAAKQPAMLDPRGPRVGAGITTVLLVVIILAGPRSPIAAVLLAFQTLMFVIGAFGGLRAHPFGWLYRKLVRPHLGPPPHLEDPRPPRFAQGVGLVFAVVGLIGLIVGLAPLFYVALGMALAAAFLNAVFGVCLGCEMYLILRRITAR